MLKIVHVINIRGFHYPRKFFNNEMFPDYGTSCYSVYAQVCALCQCLLRAGVIYSLSDEKQFEPNKRLYRFTADHHKHVCMMNGNQTQTV